MRCWNAVGESQTGVEVLAGGKFSSRAPNGGRSRVVKDRYSPTRRGFSQTRRKTKDKEGKKREHPGYSTSTSHSDAVDSRAEERRGAACGWMKKRGRNWGREKGSGGYWDFIWYERLRRVRRSRVVIIVRTVILPGPMVFFFPWDFSPVFPE